MQLPVVVLQASGEDSKAHGSAGTDRVRSLPSVTPLKPPDRKSWPSQLVIASDTERLTGSPTAEAGGKESGMIWVWTRKGSTSEWADIVQAATWMDPCVTVNLVQRHRVAVVLLFCSSPNNHHGVFYQGGSVEETGQRLRPKERWRNENQSVNTLLVKSLKISYLTAL